MRYRLLLATAAIFSPVLALAAPKPMLLPSSFAGWRQTQAQAGSDATEVDPTNAPLLKEFGFSTYEKATYMREGETLRLKAARFHDATGSFGAFTFYARPPMDVVQIGDRAASGGDHVLFQRADILVDASFGHPTAMSAAELRELAAQLSTASGGAAAEPEVAGYMPERGMVPNTLRYAAGPIGLAAIGTPLAANIVDFERSGELAVADYQGRYGASSIAVVSYPTFQIAAEQQRALARSIPGATADPNSLASTVALHSASSGIIAFRRSGPLLIYVSNAGTEDEARSLAQSVNYTASVTWSQAPPLTANAIVKVVVYSLVLALFLIAVFLALMILFGGGLVIVKKFFPNVKLPAQDKEMIKLNLRD